MLRSLSRLAIALSLCLPFATNAQTRSSASAKPRLASSPTLSEQKCHSCIQCRCTESAAAHCVSHGHAQRRRSAHASDWSHLRGEVHQGGGLRRRFVTVPATRSLFKPSATTRSLPPQPVCGEGNRRAEDALQRSGALRYPRRRLFHAQLCSQRRR